MSDILTYGYNSSGFDEDAEIDLTKVEYKPEMKIVSDLVGILYDIPDCGAGGVAHIVLDDDNIDDDDLQFVINATEKGEFPFKDRPEGYLAICIMKYLLDMTFEQRRVLFHIMMCDQRECLDSAEVFENYKNNIQSFRTTDDMAQNIGNIIVGKIRKLVEEDMK